MKRAAMRSHRASISSRSGGGSWWKRAVGTAPGVEPDSITNTPSMNAAWLWVLRLRLPPKRCGNEMPAPRTICRGPCLCPPRAPAARRRRVAPRPGCDTSRRRRWRFRPAACAGRRVVSTHGRSGTSAKTRSTRWAAVLCMRRALHEGTRPAACTRTRSAAAARAALGQTTRPLQACGITRARGGGRQVRRRRPPARRDPPGQKSSKDLRESASGL